MAAEWNINFWLGIVLVFITSTGAITASPEDLRGKNFVFAFPPNLYPFDNIFQLVLTPCNSETFVNISISSQAMHYVSAHLIPDTESLTVTLPDEIATERDDFFIHATIVVSSDKDVYVVAISAQTKTMATFPIIPTTSLGTEYVIVSYVNEEDKNGLPAEFVISTLGDNTHVTIQFTGNTLPSNDWTTVYTSTEQVQLDLLAYKSVLFRSAQGLTGTHIWSDKPISIVSGNACTFVPSDYLACDHIVEHLPPVDRWGRRYIIPPFMGRQSGYVYRVVAARNSTTITYTDEEVNTVTINSGEFIERDISTGNVSMVAADKPVIVAQYSKGNYTDGTGDPAMILITPIEQYVHDVSFTNFNVSFHNVANEYLTVITSCHYLDDLRLNGLPFEISDYSCLIRFEPTSEYCIIRKELRAEGVYRISSEREDTKFAAFQYGFGTRIAYAHPVAFGLKKLTCKGYDQYGIVGTDCKSLETDTDEDSDHPFILCPNNVTLYTSNGSPQTLSWDEPIAFAKYDDVIEVSSDHQSGSSFPVGLTRVTYSASAASGDISSCTFYVTVKETTFLCPNNQRIVADAGKASMIVAWENPTLEGADLSVTVISDHQSGNRFSLGLSTVTYFARDQSNEMIAECSFDVEVIDKESPKVSCPADIELFTPVGNVDVSVTWDAPIVLDNSGHVVGTNVSHVPGGRFRIGSTAVMYTAWDLVGNTGMCAFYVTVYAQCPEDTTTDSEVLTWPVTTAGNTAESNQRCHINTERRGHGLAIRYCSSNDNIGARWEAPQHQDCGVTTTQVELHDLEKTPVVEDNVQEVIDALAEVTRTNNVTNEEVSSVAKTLENVVNVASPSVEVTESVIQVVDNVMESVNSNASSEPSSRPVDAVSSTSILESLEHQLSLSLHAGQEIRAVRPNIAVEGLQLRQNTTHGDLSFAVLTSAAGVRDANDDLEDGNVQVFKNADQVPIDKVETSITLPKSLLTDTQKDLQISFIVFKDGALFPSEKIKNGTSRLAGSIISAAIEDVTVANLSEPVIIEITPTKIPNTTFEFNENTTGCFFYDKSTRDWSHDGCKAVWSDDVTNIGRIVCHCDHLTNFAVIVDWRGHDSIGDPKLQFALDVISKLGCALSVIALAVTIIIFLLFRKLRATRPRQILVHFCFTLFFLYLIFLVGIDASHSVVGCTIVAALLHYFTLATVAWMGVEARNMYLTLVKVFDAETPHFMARACAAGWGVPLLVVVGTLSAAFHHYRNKDYCFLSPGPSLYFGLLLPVALILLHNFVTFALVMRRLLRANVGGTLKEKGRFHNLSMRLQNALAISVLLGLTWIFGFLAIADATFTFQLLFCLFNTFQGVVVFLLFCLRQEDIRKTVLLYFKWAKCPQWSLPEWKTVPTKVTTTTTTFNGNTHARKSLPMSNEHAQNTSVDMASSTDVSLSEVRTPLQLS